MKRGCGVFVLVLLAGAGERAQAQTVVAAHSEIQLSTHCLSNNQKITATLQSKCYAMQYGGRERTLRIYASSPARGRPAMPLVFVLHGGGGTGGAMEWLTRGGFNRQADAEGAVVVYPDGIGKGWNDGRSDDSVQAIKEQVDDLGWFRALPKALAGEFNIDLTRIYATGISNGGLMSYRLACDAADVFAAVAPVAANMSVDLAPICKPARSISVAVINGTDDPVMPWGGGPVKVLWFKRGAVLSTSATVARLAELNHCSGMRDVGGVTDTVPNDGTSVVINAAACAGGSEVVLYEVRGGGHTWPQGEPYLAERWVGRVSQELDATGSVWRFFKEHGSGGR